MSNTSSLWGKHGKTQRENDILMIKIKKLRKKRKIEKQNRKKGRRQK